MPVYFIQAEGGGPIKIGFTGTKEGCADRLTKLQIGHPEHLRVTRIEEDAPFEREQELHKEYARWRIRGEWFEPCESLVKLADATLNAADAYRVGRREGFNEGMEAVRTSDELGEANEARDAAQKLNRALGAAVRTAYKALPDGELRKSFIEKCLGHYRTNGSIAPEWMFKAEYDNLPDDWMDQVKSNMNAAFAGIGRVQGGSQ